MAVIRNDLIDIIALSRTLLRKWLNYEENVNFIDPNIIGVKSFRSKVPAAGR